MQGYEQFKWKRRKILRHIETRLKETYSKLELWKGDLKRIEGNFGTGVVAFFLFIKWLLFLNLTIFSVIFLFVILPNILLVEENAKTCTGDLNSTECCSAAYFNQTITESDDIVLDLVQGTGNFERTIIFYGMYSNKTFSYLVNGTKLDYHLPLAYILITIVYFLISLCAIVKSASKGFKERLVEGEGQFYHYSNLVFGGWDFCIHNEKSAAIKHKAIYNEIKGYLEVERIEEERLNRTTREKMVLFSVRLLINLIILCVLGACAVAIAKVFIFSNEQLKNNLNEILSLIYEFLPSLCIVLLNIIIPFIFKLLVTFEHYTPIVVIRITLIRTIFLRLSSLIVLFVSLYNKISCNFEGKICYEDCIPCWETYVGQQFYKLVLTDFSTNLFLTFFINFPRAVIAKHVKNKFTKWIGEQSFDLPKHVLDIIYSQTLCWIGSFYSPVLPAICSLICFLIFYIKKFACLVNSEPSSTVYRASRSNSMFMVVLLVSFVFALLPITYSITEIVPSRSCGPFRGLESAWSVVSDAFQVTPDWIRTIVQFIGTAGFAFPAFIILIMLLYYYTAVNSANRHMVIVLKNQLVLEGHDKQFLLDRLSSFIKQQQEVQKRLRHAEIMREGERTSSSN